MQTTGDYTLKDVSDAICDWHKARLINLGDVLTRDLDHDKLISEYLTETKGDKNHPFLLQNVKIWVARNHITMALIDRLNVQSYIDGIVDKEFHSVNIPTVPQYESL